MTNTPESTSARAAASRLNGQKSRGPLTPGGKATASQNALKHGLASAARVLPAESAEAFDELAAAAQQHFAPMTPWEQTIVDAIIDAMWRLRRAATFETVWLGHQAAQIEAAGAEEMSPVQPSEAAALAFLRESHAFNLLGRYETALYRRYRHLCADLDRLARRTMGAGDDRRRFRGESGRGESRNTGALVILQHEPEPAGRRGPDQGFAALNRLTGGRRSD